MRPTLIGFTAILMWSLLALLTAASGRVPPFQLAAMTFAIGGLLGAASWIFRKGALAALRQPAEVWALGIFGLFGYHALYFFALRLAPPAESGLINYLWPLLIVLFSAFLPGEKLKPHHVIGAVLGLVGTIVLVAGRAQLGFAPEFHSRLLRGLRRGLRVGDLFGAVAPLRRGADRCGGGLLSRDRRARGDLPSGI